MKEVVIAGYLRSAQSRSRPRDPGRDWFHKVRADELLVKLLPELLKRTGLDGKDIDDFIVASAMGVNEQFSWGGRYIIFLANLPETIPAKFVDQQCGSSMAAIHIGYMEIATGSADIVLVGGMEHLTRVPIDGQMVEKGAISPRKIWTNGLCVPTNGRLRPRRRDSLPMRSCPSRPNRLMGA